MRIAVLKINVLCGFIESNGVSRIEIDLRTRRQLITLSKVARDGKFRCAEFGAPIFDCERFAGGIFQAGSQVQPMVSASDDSAHREHSFRLAFPKKCAVEFRFADKWRRLITDINEISRHHRYGKRDGNRITLTNLSTRWINGDPAGIGLCIRYFLFLLLVGARSG